MFLQSTVQNVFCVTQAKNWKKVVEVFIIIITFRLTMFFRKNKITKITVFQGKILTLVIVVTVKRNLKLSL